MKSAGNNNGRIMKKKIILYLLHLNSYLMRMKKYSIEYRKKYRVKKYSIKYIEYRNCLYKVRLGYMHCLMDVTLLSQFFVSDIVTVDVSETIICISHNVCYVKFCYVRAQTNLFSN